LVLYYFVVSLKTPSQLGNRRAIGQLPGNWAIAGQLGNCRAIGQLPGNCSMQCIEGVEAYALGYNEKDFR
jgi:hypothetical protein